VCIIQNRTTTSKEVPVLSANLSIKENGSGPFGFRIKQAVIQSAVTVGLQVELKGGHKKL
jgi:hypothetical protein